MVPYDVVNMSGNPKILDSLGSVKELKRSNEGKNHSPRRFISFVAILQCRWQFVDECSNDIEIISCDVHNM